MGGSWGEEASLFPHRAGHLMGRQAFPRTPMVGLLPARDPTTRPNELVENPTQHQQLDYSLFVAQPAEVASGIVYFQP